MASASSSSARNLFSDSKSRINQRVQFTVQGLGSLCKYLVKSSKSSEILMQSAKHFSQQESHMESADLVNKQELTSLSFRTFNLLLLFYRIWGKCKSSSHISVTSLSQLKATPKPSRMFENNFRVFKNKSNFQCWLLIIYFCAWLCVLNKLILHICMVH